MQASLLGNNEGGAAFWIQNKICSEEIKTRLCLFVNYVNVLDDAAGVLTYVVCSSGYFMDGWTRKERLKLVSRDISWDGRGALAS